LTGNRGFFEKFVSRLILQFQTRVAKRQGALPNGRATTDVRLFLHHVERGVHLLSRTRNTILAGLSKTFCDDER
jgi:hypothetical protein